ncbi:MAG: hypothetical protein KDK70_02945 [Myxococcales bacterium]|nr:hypothetical protein [Myxococcales bacterium]
MRSRTAIALIACAACTVPPRGEQTTSETFGGPTANDESDSSTSAAVSSDEAGTSSESSTGSSGETETDTGIKLDVGADTEGPPPAEAEVFGHSGTVLYRLDPDTLEVEVVGPFTGCTASIIDIALDAQSRMYGTAFGSLWSIDRTTAQCTMIAQGSYPTSLSFVPAGTVDPVEEALVGFVDEQYIRIDTQTGAVTNLGTLTGGLASSGDMVSVIDGGSWLTVVGPGCDAGDCIVEIDPVDGTVLHNYGPLPYDQVFGLAFWAGRAYGFARQGQLFSIEFMGGSVSTTPIPIPGAPVDLEFFGAGSTTAAPPAG